MYFIRCIIPNNDKQNAKFDEELVLRQLKTSCTISYAKFIRFGYTKRIDFKDLVDKCEPLEQKFIKYCYDRMHFYSKVLLSIGFILEDFNAIFFRSKKFQLLEDFLCDATATSFEKIKRVFWRSKWRCVLMAIRFLSRLFCF